MTFDAELCREILYRKILEKMLVRMEANEL